MIFIGKYLGNFFLCTSGLSYTPCLGDQNSNRNIKRETRIISKQIGFLTRSFETSQVIFSWFKCIVEPGRAQRSLWISLRTKARGSLTKRTRIWYMVASGGIRPFERKLFKSFSNTSPFPPLCWSIFWKMLRSMKAGGLSGLHSCSRLSWTSPTSIEPGGHCNVLNHFL